MRVIHGLPVLEPASWVRQDGSLQERPANGSGAIKDRGDRARLTVPGVIREDSFIGYLRCWLGLTFHQVDDPPGSHSNVSERLPSAETTEPR